MKNREQERLEALDNLGVMYDDAPDYLAKITRLTAAFFGAAGSYISLIDSDFQWVLAKFGGCPENGPRDQSFCNHTIERDSVTVVPDTANDSRFRDSPFIKAPLHIRFYAGAPLVTNNGHAIGAICITDTKPREFSETDSAHLKNIADLVCGYFVLRKAFGRVDAVSGMSNKYQLARDLEELHKRANTENRVLLYLDVPDASTAFEIASAFGIEVHDNMIRGVAKKLQSIFQGRAAIYHLTDARFALLSVDGNTDDYRDFFCNLGQALLEPIYSKEVPLSLPTFGGYVEFQVNASAASEAPRRALSAINHSISTNSRWSIYTEDHDRTQQRSFKILNDVREAIAGHHFHLVYQPKHALTSGICSSVEALLRWTHPELGTIPPAEFIPLVERSALMRDITEWVMRNALAQAEYWQGLDLCLKIAINLSARNFEEKDICRRLASACAEFNVLPSCVEIECTEGVWMESHSALDTLQGIRDLGMEIALDDFGTGYSNFSYLQKVPATAVKLDQSLIRNIQTNAHDRRLVRSVISLARDLGFRITAEGVETQGALEMLMEWGCDEAQGYVLAKPLDAATLELHAKKYKYGFK